MQVLRSLKNNLFSPIEVKVRDCTCSDPWPASSSQMAEIAAATKDHLQYPQLISMLWKRLVDHRNYLHVQKALLLVEYLLRYGSDRFVRDCINRKDDIYKLRRYQFLNEDNVDVTKDVRKKARIVYDLLEDPEALKAEREKGSRLRNVKDTHYSHDTYHGDHNDAPHREPSPDDEPRHRAPSSGSGHGSNRRQAADPYDSYSSTSKQLSEEQKQAARRTQRAPAAAASPDDNPFDNEPAHDPFASNSAPPAAAADDDKPKKKKKSHKSKKDGDKPKKSKKSVEAPAEEFDSAFEEQPQAAAPPRQRPQPSVEDDLAAALGQKVVVSKPQPRAAPGHGVDLLTGDFAAGASGASWQQSFNGDNEADDAKGNGAKGAVAWMAGGSDNESDDDDEPDEPAPEAPADPWGLVDVDNISAQGKKKEDDKKKKPQKKGQTMQEMMANKPSVSVGTAIPGFEATAAHTAAAPASGLDVFFSNTAMPAGPAPGPMYPPQQAYPQYPPQYPQQPYGVPVGYPPQPQPYGYPPQPYGYPPAGPHGAFPGPAAPAARAPARPAANNDPFNF